jgi:hypothetical protein
MLGCCRASGMKAKANGEELGEFVYGLVQLVKE